MSITITSLPSGTFNQTIAEGTSSDSAELVKYLFIDTNDDLTEETITVAYNGETITLTLVDECRYTPVEVYFINKEGCQQVMHFFKAKTDSISITSESYEGNNGQPSLGNHQFIDYNVNSKSKFKVNSGFVAEVMNETIKQLLLSERVWMYENTTYTPLNVGSKSLEFKTREKDRLINYEIEFEYSFNDVNTI